MHSRLEACAINLIFPLTVASPAIVGSAAGESGPAAAYASENVLIHELFKSTLVMMRCGVVNPYDGD
jgi:hypothetical protein